MKKLILICLFILLFSVNCFAYDSTFYPSNAISYIAANNTGNYDFTDEYLIAYNYFATSSNFNKQNYVYIFPSSGSSNIVTFRYIGSPYKLVLDNTSISSVASARRYSYFYFLDSSNNILPTSMDFSVVYEGFCTVNSSGNVSIDSYLPRNNFYSTFDDFIGNESVGHNVIRYSAGSFGNGDYYFGNNDTVSSFFDIIYSKDGDILEIRSNSSDIGFFTNDANSDTTEYSSSFYDLYITRNNLTQVSNGSYNFYKYTDLNVKFSNYFIQNYGEIDNYSIFVSVYNSGSITALIDNYELTSPYSNNVLSITINGNEDFLRNFHGYLDIYLYYSADGGVTKLGETSYSFNITAIDPSSATLPNGIDNTITTTGNNGDIPNYVENTINIINNQNNASGDTTFLDGFESFVDGILGIPKYIIGMVRGIFSSLSGVIDLFRITFSWLPSEIVGIIFSGLMLGSLWIVIKAIRGG